MDARHFDALTRRFTRTRSRRGALRLLAGTAVTTALGRHTVVETSAKRLCADCETGCCTGKGGTCEPGTVVEACGAGGKKCSVCDAFAEVCQGGGCCVPGRGACGKGQRCCEDVRCTDGACCSSAGKPCQTADNCCDPFAHTCEGGKCCVPDGGECTKKKECCSGTCNNGTCGCAQNGDKCPKNCKTNQNCAGCCGNGVCTSDRHCFSF
jgi:hypothetical protein